MVEVAIAERYGVSRTPVREALKRLEQDGLVERGPRGLVVRERSPEEILDIYEVRIVLEATAARLAAEKHTELDVVRLTALLESYDKATAGTPAERAAVNDEFHRAVWRASRNQSLVDVLHRLRMHVARYPETTLSYPGRYEETQREHRAMVEAILRRDGAEAGRLAAAHFERAREIRLELWGLGSDLL